MEKNDVVNGKVWSQIRIDFLKKEKEFTKLRDELSAARRNLPMEPVDKNYIFNTSQGEVTLEQLFKDKSQLIVYHFMFAPEWNQGCKNCSYLADNFDGMLPHLTNSDVAFVVISRAPIKKLNDFKARMSWSFDWASSEKNEFNYDYHISFKENQNEIFYNYKNVPKFSAEGPGASVFYKNKSGEIFHTYSTYGRGLDMLISTYHFIDMTPLGRTEKSPMDWIKLKDKY